VNDSTLVDGSRAPAEENKLCQDGVVYGTGSDINAETTTFAGIVDEVHRAEISAAIGARNIGKLFAGHVRADAMLAAGQYGATHLTATNLLAT